MGGLPPLVKLLCRNCRFHWPLQLSMCSPSVLAALNHVLNASSSHNLKPEILFVSNASRTKTEIDCRSLTCLQDRSLSHYVEASLSCGPILVAYLYCGADY